MRDTLKRLIFDYYSEERLSLTKSSNFSNKSLILTSINLITSPEIF